MPVDLQKLAALKAQAEAAERRRQQALGRRQELLARLRDDFGCADREAAAALLKKLDKEHAAQEAEYKKLEATADAAYGEQLDGEDDS